mmetsp:Transcript_94680/g.265109  ORF Transcript_94680/g.265109 Transcript_94680/m.265109 type:complete len:207 (+) Transcript_94680:910-1530(+)
MGVRAGPRRTGERQRDVGPRRLQGDERLLAQGGRGHGHRPAHRLPVAGPRPGHVRCRDALEPLRRHRRAPRRRRGTPRGVLLHELVPAPRPGGRQQVPHRARAAPLPVGRARLGPYGLQRLLQRRLGVDVCRQGLEPKRRLRLPRRRGLHRIRPPRRPLPRAVRAAACHGCRYLGERLAHLADRACEVAVKIAWQPVKLVRVDLMK